MEVNIVSATIQEFEGLRYWRCGKYFQRYGVRLHRAVWERANGRAVPVGYDVHHDDEDRSNNQPANLKLMVKAEHMAHHNTGHGRGTPAAATEAARQWHSSDAGRDWHKQHYAEHADKLHQRVAMVCAHCGVGFDGMLNGLTKFCSNNCKTKHRKASGVDDEQRTCLVCGSGFVANRYAAKATCSRRCSAALCSRTKLGTS